VHARATMHYRAELLWCSASAVAVSSGDAGTCSSNWIPKTNGRWPRSAPASWPHGCAGTGMRRRSCASGQDRPLEAIAMRTSGAKRPALIGVSHDHAAMAARPGRAGRLTARHERAGDRRGTARDLLAGRGTAPRWNRRGVSGRGRSRPARFCECAAIRTLRRGRQRSATSGPRVANDRPCAIRSSRSMPCHSWRATCWMSAGVYGI
jgi:hypothetical protein